MADFSIATRRENMVGGGSPSNGISQGKTQYGYTAPGVEARGSARGGGQGLSQGWRSGLEARASARGAWARGLKVKTCLRAKLASGR